MRRALGLALAAGLIAFLPASSAHAQAAYGYDSWIYNVPSGASFWNSAGYPGVYTDRTTNSFMDGEVAPFRGVAPFGQPPASLGASDGLRYAAPPVGVLRATPAQPARVQQQRRPLIMRRPRTRR